MVLRMNLPGREYEITVERGALGRADEYFDLKRRVLIVTDSGVPEEYANTVAALSKEPTTVTISEGEESKCTDVLESLLCAMVKNSFTRSDCVVAVGGGVCGDLAGFAAAIYMRGIDFYNIPTTVLSQVDSSIGGKVAIDFLGVKNIVGAFHQPKGVIVDPETLNTLPRRQVANGLAEALKMSMTSDRALFKIFEDGMAEERIDEVIIRSLMIKKAVVEKDEKESGLRKILNFGHTLGHGIEAVSLGRLYHGECVALGMIPMCAPAAREKLLLALRCLGLPTEADFDVEEALSIASHDKKRSGDDISVVYVEEIGSCEIRRMPLETFKNTIRQSSEA